VLHRCLMIVPALGLLVTAGNAAAETPTTPPAAAPAASAATGIDESNLDPTVDPCDDFYRFACGGWIQRTEIPADRSRWGAFSEIEERNLALLRKTLEDDAAGKAVPGDAYGAKLGDIYAACMDETRIERTAGGELKTLLAGVAGVRDARTLARHLAAMHLQGDGAAFSFGSQQDFADARQVIGGLDQGGLGLPDRDYYVKDDGKFPEIRGQYVEHVAKMMALAGEPEAAAKQDAATVMRIETALAHASLALVDRRDPKRVYHRIDLAGIQQTAPTFPWRQYLSDLGFPGITALNVAVPDFFAALDGLVRTVPMADWRTYLRWHVVHGTAALLSKAFVEENFRFYGKALNGEKELRPRWKRCIASADHAMGEALGQSFVRQTFGEEGKQRTKEAVAYVEAAMLADLKGLSWMDEATRKAAEEKLANIANKIGYPDAWRNYDALKVGRTSYLKNAMAAAAFETRRDLGKIGKPLDRTEWLMSPPTVNAYYDPSMNEMVFPAGILQRPFYDRAARLAVNYGAIGMVMGHELTHGFDDEGRQFDAHGNLRDWWSPDVGKEFDRRAECVAKQYDGYVAVDDLHLNGHLTLGENLADLGGIKLAYHAWLAAQKESLGAPEAASSPARASPGNPSPAPTRSGGKAPPAAGRFTDAQLFFLGTAQAWCTKTRPENARLRVTVDPHSPPEHRVNGPMSNSPEFRDAFQCKAGSRMVRPEPCAVW